MSGNHFLRSMADPICHEPETIAASNETPEVHFAETVSVVTEVNKLAEAPLVDVPLELTTKADVEVAEANDQIRRSASRDRDMKDEEGLVLKAVPREASEEPSAEAKNAAEVAEGVENLDISPDAAGNKRKSQGETEQPNGVATGRKETRRGRKPGTEKTDGSNSAKPRRAGRRGSIPSENEPAQELRRSKRRKSQ